MSKVISYTFYQQFLIVRILAFVLELDAEINGDASPGSIAWNSIA